MAQLKLNQFLKSQIDALKLLTTDSQPPIIFKLDNVSFKEEELIDRAESKERVIIGRIFPNSDIFKEGTFQIKIELSPAHPINPPKVRFITPIYHPNVGKDGEFHHELLMKTNQWKADKSLMDVIKAIVKRIDEPDIDYSINHEAAEEYAQNRTEFNRKALEMVNNYSLPRN